jgi:multidrug efflux pump
MAQFFIHRPVLAWVLAIVTMIAGIAGITTLSVSQYPEVAPPTIRISATYRGASAEAVQNSVTTPIEDAMTGLEGLLYMTSTSREGSASLQLIFDQSIKADQAQIDVQNKLSLVESQLPDTVTDEGLRVSRSSNSILMIGALVSPDGRYSTVELGNILEQRVTSAVQRTEGVGSINSFGSGYAMRIWLDPFQLAKYSLVPADISTAVQAQNTTVTVGTLGEAPSVRGQQMNATITAQTQLQTVDQFRNILLKTDDNGAQVRLGEVARVELGQETYGEDSFFNGKNAAGFGVNLAAGANAVDTAAAVRTTIDRLQSALPEGVQVVYAYDTSPFVQLSIEKVVHTLIEAIVLVFLVILVFLQNWRATLIPVLAVPVVLLGTFAVLAVAGYSINTLTMFAMVLAIGLLVDDAIVVVENVERVMEEDGLGPVEATVKSMRQITGALVGIAAVLSAVFLPMAFMSGSTGVIYRQFSVTIISAMALSALVALVLTPALCATVLRKRHGRVIAPARWFNAGFERLTHLYLHANRLLARWPAILLAILLAIGLLAGYLFTRLPSSFLPDEDRGVMMTIIRLREGTPIAQTQKVVQEIEHYLLNDEKDTVASTFSTLGFGFSGNGSNAAMIFVKLRDFDERKTRATSSQALIQRAEARFADMRLGTIRFAQPPAIQGMGSTAGFSMYLLDVAARGHSALQEAAQKLTDLAETDKRLTGLRGGTDNTESALKLNVDTEKARSYGLTLSEVNSMLSVIFSGKDLGDFELGTDLRPVIVQGDAPFRAQPSDIDDWSARNDSDEMVPFPAFTSRRSAPVTPCWPWRT